MYVDDTQNQNSNSKAHEELTCEESNHSCGLPASRFCRRCNVVICAECTLESHVDHIGEATTKVEDYLQKGREDLSNVLLKADVRLNNSLFVKGLGEEMKNLKKTIEEVTSQNEKNIQILMSKLENVVETNKKIKNKIYNMIDQNTEKLISNETYQKVLSGKKYYKDAISNWASENKLERLKMIRRKQLIEMELVDQIESLVSLNNKSRSHQNAGNMFEDGFENMLNDLKIKTNLLPIQHEIDARASLMQSQLNKTFSFLEKNEVDMNREIGGVSEEINKIHVEKPVEKNLGELAAVKTDKNNLTPSINSINGLYTPGGFTNNYSFTPNPDTPKSNVQTLPKFNTPTSIVTSEVKPQTDSAYDYYITLKLTQTNKSESYIVFTDLKRDPETIQKFKVEDALFPDCKKNLPVFPPDHSKWINLGKSLLVTGGSLEGKQIDNCYLVKIKYSSSHLSYNFEIKDFPKLKTKRERHNMIFLKDKNLVIACGGFYTKTTESFELNGQEWNLLPSLRLERTNATMMYLNSRYVYCIGGYEVTKEKSNGTYLSSCEYLDLMNSDVNGKGWVYLNLEAMFRVNFKLCAMGVIQYQPNHVLLVGGFDGTKYLSECHEMIFDSNDRLKELNNVKATTGLGKGFIFYHSEFTQVDKKSKFLNFDIHAKLLIYDAEKKSFSCKAIMN